MLPIKGTGLDDNYNYKVDREGRKSGVLCHITSLASPYGIGTLGDQALDFIDFLVLSGQSCWQILPLGVTGFGDSPYQSFSGNAGNPYIIDPDELVREGLLPQGSPEQFVFVKRRACGDFGRMWENRRSLLRLAWDSFREGEFDSMEHEFATFCEHENGTWLHDFALFMTIKTMQGGAPWSLWPLPYKLRDPVALLEFESANADDLEFEKFLQFLFFRQWNSIRSYAANAGLEIIGDLPIYVAEDSVEVWMEP